ncbi:hypothetical protein [Paenibacillus sp. CR_12]|uniref:hypothetical protein n=1 Tax=Paenibacillus sp. CR_12 TaxID=3055793 RepID=UPI0035BF7AF7
MQYNSIIPAMKSDAQDGFSLSFQGFGSINTTLYNGVDGDSTTYFRSNASPRLPEYFIVSFPKKHKIGRYSIEARYSNYRIQEWEFQGLINGNWVTLHTGSRTDVPDKITYDFSPTIVEGVRIKCNSRYGVNSWQFGELEVYEVVTSKTLIKNKDRFYKFNNQTNIWEELLSEPQEVDYIQYGIDDISIVPESAWSYFTDDIELCYYTDDTNKTEVLFSIKTEPFTLAEEWEDQTIKIIEYSDGPYKTESTILLETEKFYYDDEIKGSVDVLYYTDDPRKTSSEMELTANYSPLDELNGDFDIVSWTDKEDIDEFKINMSALPFSQLIIQDEDFQVYGDLQQILIHKISNQGSIKILLSFDGGRTWEYYKFNEWRSIDITNEDLIRNKAMDINSLTGLTMNDFSKKGKNKIRIAYYLDDNIRQQEYTKIDNLKIVSNAPIEDVKFTDVAFYLLNTLATIQLTFGGNKLMGQLEDADQGKVQYRVFLNNKPYYPSNGEFTPIAPSPIDISLNISEKDILFGQNNDLTVEFQDAWGQLDTWSTTFIGTYSGLMFMDETGQYYSNSFGGILKYLDFGIVIAGQTTMEQKVIVKNQLGQDVQNLILEVMKDQLPPGVEVELSYDNKPVFVPEDYLLFNKYIYPNDEMEFYVRITTSLTAPPAPNGQFEIRAKVDSV